MKRFRSLFQRNIKWKLLALVSALLIWLVVVNSSNPQVTGSVSISFDVLNENALVTSGEVYTLSTDTISVSYTVRQKFYNQITPEAFTAYINLEDYSVTGAVPVYLEVDSAISDLITDIRITPSIVHVYTESIQQKKFPVKPNLQGEVAEGYIIEDVTLNPEYIYVKGPVSVMGQITSVGINIDAEGKTDNFDGIATVEFLDANGNTLKGIEGSLSYAGDIYYSVSVYRIKSLAVTAFTSGAPASGYMIDSIETSPTFISVYGPEEILNQHSYILIPGSAINVNRITKNTTYNIDATPYIPSGLTLTGQSPEITVYVKVRSIYSKPDSEQEETAVQTEPISEQETQEQETSVNESTVDEQQTEETFEEKETISEQISETDQMNMPVVETNTAETTQS